VKPVSGFAVERVSFPRRFVPHAVLIADDLDRHDHDVGAEVVGLGDAVVELPTGLLARVNISPKMLGASPVVLLPLMFGKSHSTRAHLAFCGNESST
jgi:hypothetical protein